MQSTYTTYHAMENTNEPKFTIYQKVSLGIAAAFYTVYKVWLKDPEIIKNLGVIYPYVIMVWTLIMLFSAGMSGWALLDYIKTPKNIFKSKKPDDDD